MTRLAALACALGCVLASAAGELSATPPAVALRVWRLADGRVAPDEGADERHGVGSLQKAWLLAAWAEAHPEAPLPVVECTRESRCWLPAGHGRMDLRGATAHSCNAYFRALALVTPAWRIEEAFRRAGFELDGAPDPDAAIGLTPTRITITPRALLRAYAALATTPWPVREDARRGWLDGMRDAARVGTAARVPLPGLLAKTGTVPSGRTLGTSGWALVVDPAGTSASLAFLPNGTGGDAAAALGAILLAERPWARERVVEAPRARRAARSAARTAAPPAGARETVRVRLFTALAGFAVRARNVGNSPASRESGGATSWIAAGAEIALATGDRLGASRWELTLPETGLVRVMDGAIDVRGAPPRVAFASTGGAPAMTLVLTTSVRAYTEGVIRGELGAAAPARAEELAAAVLRFLARGSRHGTEDVCDLSHCARFVGLGPPASWDSATRARLLPGSPRFDAPLDDAAWSRAVAAARAPGPWSWSAHCGGDPLSAHAVWGSGGDEAPACPRHPVSAALWTRDVPARDMDAALGEEVVSLTADVADGVRVTRVAGRERTRMLRYDELHALLAARAGWDALPSPPDSWERTPTGWRAAGRGSGHRVGVCLAD